MNIFNQRIEKLKQLLEHEECDGLIVDDTINLYYLTGLYLSAGKLLISPKETTLLVDSRYYELCKSDSPFPVVLSTKTSTINDLLSGSGIKQLAFNSDNTTYGEFKKLEKEAELLNLKPISNPILKLRAIKDSQEIETLKEAAALGSAGYDYLVELLKEGISETELAIELEIFWKRRGSKAIAFDPIIAFGSNSSMPHYRVGQRRLNKGESVLIDIGVNLDHYHSDMTRVVFFGEPDPKITNIYRIVLEAQEKALALCRPGTLIADLDAAARSHIEEQGYGENFTHSLGHGVGLEIHELPIIRSQNSNAESRLEEGMVITIEPGIYLPGIGGVRIEDTVAITKGACENLTNRSKQLITI
ncbi:Xaa-Pro dipeptidase [Waddlia chondrophila 2032/99]|uniref:Aminopeptidase P n=2 Tax=Waddlia chondrophila TaxID=71667 RepID=D6YT12_WADCW|nr:Xaa-Pro peptidase family protein [Waddlia chondrophila]ADI39207.1 aminopeptidase P [Waddlia chondrophila WSU 86-1044]CCB90671.1 Xaa-Pro dipeptidase [Waddlia chondrophila 2032/99]